MLLLWSSIYTALAEPLDAELLYFILVDRFADGQSIPEQISYLDTSDIAAFHGGDLQGVTAQLNHLERMGVDAVWLSPIFEMRHEKFMGHGAIHGYWHHSMDKIDPFFGGEKGLQLLASELKEREWDLILDMVYNHVSFDSPMVKLHPDWFHEAHTIEDWNDPYQLVHYQVHGLPDLNHDREAVYRYLHHRSLFWQQKSSAAGFRIDAIRHMDNQFLHRLSDDLHQELGNDFWLLGEDFNGSSSALAERALTTGLDALFDFPLYYAMTDTFCRDQPPAQLAATLWADRDYPEQLQLVRFLDNHDLPRIASICDENSFQQALFFLFSVQGLPMLTYGTEFGIQGAQEPENRASISWEESPQWLSLIASLNKMRGAHPVLKKGTAEIIALEEDLLLYGQRLGEELAIIGINQGEEPYQLPYSTPDVVYSLKEGHLVQSLTTELAPQEMMLWIWNKAPTAPPFLKSIHIEIEAPAKTPLSVVGSSAIFGGWNPEKALALNWVDGRWQTDIEIPSDAVLLWKIVAHKEGHFVWEEGENHLLWQEPTIEIKLK